VAIAVIGVALLVALLVGFSSTSGLIRATSACFVAVYVAATASAVRILPGLARVGALIALAMVLVVTAFSGWYLLVPGASAVCFVAIRERGSRGRARAQATLELP
ncbi:MAG: hypothetical protein ABI317_04680, partial [Gaiellales bacterium]